MIDFTKYDNENPHIWAKFQDIAMRAKHIAGFKRYSAKGIFEIMRWETSVKAKNDSFKVNNNYTAYYARKMMSEHKEFIGFFLIRNTK